MNTSEYGSWEQWQERSLKEETANFSIRCYKDLEDTCSCNECATLVRPWLDIHYEHMSGQIKQGADRSEIVKQVARAGGKV